VRGCLLTVLFMTLTSLGRVDAITVVPMTFEQLVDESVAIVYARVADVRGHWTTDGQSIESLITLESLRYLKGDLGATLLTRLPGGEVGGIVNVLPGAPVLRQGDLVVLFLAARGPAIPTVLGLGQGIFRIVPDPRSGVPHVTPPPLKSSVAGRVIRGSADRRLLTLDAFESTVRSLGAAQ
jgi:hypothetical protein